MTAKCRIASAPGGSGTDIRRAEPEALGVDDLAGRVDLALAIFVVHEMPDRDAFFSAVHRTLKPEGRLLIAEPRRHVPEDEFHRSLEAASRAGFTRPGGHSFPGARAMVLART